MSITLDDPPPDVQEFLSFVSTLISGGLEEPRSAAHLPLVLSPFAKFEANSEIQNSAKIFRLTACSKLNRFWRFDMRWKASK
jgi:hypothetical protein